MESLGIGGAEKSLLSLLSMFDYDTYSVDLFLFRQEGEFLDLIPHEVNLLSEDKKFEIFSRNRKLAPLCYLITGDIGRFWHSSMYLLGSLGKRILGEQLYIGWNHVKHLFDNRTMSADVSIAFLERRTIYFNVDKVLSKKKVGFIHTDYSKYPFDKTSDKKYFEYYDAIAAVSEQSKEVLEQIFPEYKQKFKIVKNIVASDIIKIMSEENIADVEKREGEYILVTVGRLISAKGYSDAVKACKMLVDKGRKVKWYAIGEGPEREMLQAMINSLELQSHFILIGAQKNPYKWMRIADVYVQPSLYEGFGLTVAEANILGKPIVCSDIPQFQEQLGNRTHCYSNTITDMVNNIIGQLEGKQLEYDEVHYNNSRILKSFYEIIT